MDSVVKHIKIAIVGNPNSGKTSLYNHITGKHEHVGNYGGTTIEAQTTICHYKGYDLHVTDLPGANALSGATPQEEYVRKYLAEHTPDIVLNVVCASNLERNLYITTELIDIGYRMVVALNMYDVGSVLCKIFADITLLVCSAREGICTRKVGNVEFVALVMTSGYLSLYGCTSVIGGVFVFARNMVV